MSSPVSGGKWIGWSCAGHLCDSRAQLAQHRQKSGGLGVLRPPVVAQKYFQIEDHRPSIVLEMGQQTRGNDQVLVQLIFLYGRQEACVKGLELHFRTGVRDALL